MTSKLRGSEVAGEANEIPDYCVGGVRCIWSRESDPGSTRELREPVVLILRENANGYNHECETPMQGTGAERSVVAVKEL
jgi:hypothetical protein